MSEDFDREALIQETIFRAAQMLRAEFTVMPRFGYHQPLDYLSETLPPEFGAPVIVEGVDLPLPPAEFRMGYPADNTLYLEWGKYDHDLLIEEIKNVLGQKNNVSILDFGCSSGRILRHFEEEHNHLGWNLYGVDIQATPIEWMRRHFPQHFTVYVGSTMPHLPFPDSSLDVIYGFSIFTHIKYHWDFWLLELRRVLKPGGLLIQTVHTENAWNFYINNKDEEWVKNNHSPLVYNSESMKPDFFYYGDISVSQVFWKKEIVREFWGRYFKVLDVRDPPPKHSFQDWVICQKDQTSQP